MSSEEIREVPATASDGGKTPAAEDVLLERGLGADALHAAVVGAATSGASTAAVLGVKEVFDVVKDKVSRPEPEASQVIFPSGVDDPSSGE